MALILEWHDRATCYQAFPPVEFFPDHPRDAAQTIADYCDRCPVVQECAADAIGLGTQISGIWGGVYLPPVGSHRLPRRKEAFVLLRQRAMLEHRDDAA